MGACSGWRAALTAGSCCCTRTTQPTCSSRSSLRTAAGPSTSIASARPASTHAHEAGGLVARPARRLLAVGTIGSCPKRRVGPASAPPAPCSAGSAAKRSNRTPRAAHLRRPPRRGTHGTHHTRPDGTRFSRETQRVSLIHGPQRHVVTATRRQRRRRPDGSPREPGGGPSSPAHLGPRKKAAARTRSTASCSVGRCPTATFLQAPCRPSCVTYV